MNYYEARQRKEDGRWDWTCRNDGQIWRVPPCSDHEDGHATREEAERHFYEHEMAGPEEAVSSAHYRCAVDGCETLTDRLLRVQIGLITSFLCDEHRNAEVFRQLHPFKSGVSIMASW